MHPLAGRRRGKRRYPNPRWALSRRWGRFSGARGVVLVEFALVLPVILFMALGAAEMAFLFAHHADQDRRTGALASWAAEHPDATEQEWSLMVVQVGPCASAERSAADEMITVAMTCSYVPRITSNMWDGLLVSTEAVAAIRGEVAAATGTPEPSAP